MNKGRFLPPGSTIGILGGGQLGRMLSLAAARLGMKTHILCPDAHSPAFEVTPYRTITAYEDEAALAAFAESVDIVTYEFENVPLATAAFLSGLGPVVPDMRALAVAQDRLDEKRFLVGAGADVAPFRAVASHSEFLEALRDIGIPAVLKTTRLGYNGKGQRMIATEADAEPAFAALGGRDLVLEAFIPFECEISVVVARSEGGDIRAYDPAENIHRNHMLFTSTVPAALLPSTRRETCHIAERIVHALDYVGVMGIEFFVVPDDPEPHLLVNEIAPRVHNSGHWTESICVTDQFEQHIRAICGWPLGDTTRLADVEMINLIGDEIDGVADRLRPGDQPHVYGKAEARPGRKMGHLNRIILR